MKRGIRSFGIFIVFCVYAVVGFAQNDSIIFSITKPLCYGDCNGSISALVTGTNAPYSFLWSNAATTNSITGLCAGDYTLSVTNNNSVTTTSVVSLTQPGQLGTNQWYCGLSCMQYASYGSTVCINPVGGTSPYTFDVVDMNGTFVYSDVPANQFGACFWVVQGAYNVILKDSNNCQVPLYGNFIILDSTNCSTTFSSPSCTTCCDGVVQLNFTNPCPTCSSTLYQNGNTYTSSTNTFTNVCLGAYTITATNYNCQSTFIDTLARPATVTSIGELSNFKDFEVFPNPSDGIIKINHTSKVKQIIILNPLGIIVKEIIIENPTTTTINLNDYAKGIYLIEIMGNNNHVLSHKKVVLE